MNFQHEALFELHHHARSIVYDVARFFTVAILTAAVAMVGILYVVIGHSVPPIPAVLVALGAWVTATVAIVTARTRRIRLIERQRLASFRQHRMPPPDGRDGAGPIPGHSLPATVRCGTCMTLNRIPVVERRMRCGRCHSPLGTDRSELQVQTLNR